MGPLAVLSVLLLSVSLAICAKADGQPCAEWVGGGGSGHYVKMVHNGIEYGDMQLICEAYAMLRAAGFSTDEMADIFEGWNEGISTMAPLIFLVLQGHIQVAMAKHGNLDVIPVDVPNASNQGTLVSTILTRMAPLLSPAARAALDALAPEVRRLVAVTRADSGASRLDQLHAAGRALLAVLDLARQAPPAPA